MRPPRASWWRSASPEVSLGAPSSTLGRLPRPGVSSSPGPLFRIGSARAPRGAPRFPGLLWPLPRGVSLGRCRRRGGGPSTPRAVLPRSVRACARVRPGGPSRAGVRVTRVKVDLRLAGRSPFPLGRGVGPGPGPSAPVPVPRLGRGGRAGWLRSPSLWPSSGVRHPCARARRRGSEPGLGRAPGLDRRRARSAAAARARLSPGPGTAVRLSLAVRTSGPPRGVGERRPRLAAARARARGRRLPRGCRARIGRSVSSHAGRARGGGRRARRGGCWVGCARARA